MPQLCLQFSRRATAFGLAFTALLPVVSAQAQESETLAKIKSTGAITFGYRESSFGFSYLDGNLKPVGYSIDICKRIVDAVKTELKMPTVEIKYQAVTSATRIPLVQNGTVDLECGSTTNLVERQKASGVFAGHLPLQRAHAGEGRFGHQEHCGPAGQDGGHHGRDDVVPSAARG